MRKALVLFLLLAVLAAGVLCCAAVQLTADLYHPEITQQTLLGDPAAAAGLQVYADWQAYCQLFWWTTFAPDGAAATDFAYFRSAHLADDFFRVQPGLELDPYQIGGGYSDYGISLDGGEGGWAADLCGGLEALYADLADRTPAGETRTEAMPLADWMTYYPLQVTLQLNESLWQDYYVAPGEVPADGEWEADTSPRQLRRMLSAALQVPVDAADCPQLSVTKDDEGTVTAVQVSSDTAPAFGMVSTVLPLNADGSGACLFAFASDWALRQHWPAGYGVWCLPYGAGQDTPDFAVYPDRLSLALPLPQDTRVLAMAPAQQNDAVLLVCQGAAGCTLTVLDAVTLQPLQQLPLPLTPQADADTGLPQCRLTVGAGFAAVEAGDALALVAQEDSAWQLAFCADLRVMDDAMTAQGYALYARRGQTLAWDGQRLAIGRYLAGSGRNGMLLAVWTADGLAWLGCCESSLDCNVGADAGAVLTVGDAPAVSWQD